MVPAISLNFIFLRSPQHLPLTFLFILSLAGSGILSIIQNADYSHIPDDFMQENTILIFLCQVIFSVKFTLTGKINYDRDGN